MTLNRSLSILLNNQTFYMNFLNCFKAEWIKKKRSLASWLVILGGFFTPAIFTGAALYRSNATRKSLLTNDYWSRHWLNSWESIALFLLPMGIILATSLVTQIEFKNNTWKQLHTAPQTFTNMFLAKLAVILVMLLQFLLLFNFGTYLSGVLPSVLLKDALWPLAAIPYKEILANTVYFFLDCLPIVAFQYLISLQFKNFLVPVSVGMAMWIMSIAALSWEYSYLIPFSQGSLYYMKIAGRIKRDIPIHQAAIAYFVLATVISYILYLTKKEKG